MPFSILESYKRLKESALTRQKADEDMTSHLAHLVRLAPEPDMHLDFLSRLNQSRATSTALADESMLDYIGVYYGTGRVVTAEYAHSFTYREYFQHCSGCVFRFCGVDCQRSHWVDHKTECLEAQLFCASLGGQLDPSQTFEATIISFKAEVFTKASYAAFIMRMYATYVLVPEKRLDQVSERGCFHLNAIVVIALNDFNADRQLVWMSLLMLEAYINWFYGDRDILVPIRTQTLFHIGALDPVMNIFWNYHDDVQPLTGRPG